LDSNLIFLHRKYLELYKQATSPRCLLVPFHDLFYFGCEALETIRVIGTCQEDARLEFLQSGIVSRPDIDPLDLVENRCRELGLAAAGWVSYEYGRLLEALPASTQSDLPFELLRFDLYQNFEMEKINPEDLPQLNFIKEDSDNLNNAKDLAFGTAWSAEYYQHNVERIRELIFEGDLYQANLTQRFNCQFSSSVIELFKELWSANRAAYSALLEPQKSKHIISSSPELFLRKKQDRLIACPIKGTIKSDCGHNQAGEELLGSAKDRAELAMIVDLVRNDLSRVCYPGSVKVDSFPELLKLPTLYHTTATVSGLLKPGSGLAACFKAAFPSGSITGCPRIRAMQRIDELEDKARGPYTGSIGIVLPEGDFIFNVAIRTALILDDVLLYQAGGGITIDSNAEAELAESRLKAEAFLMALNACRR
jgi:anthranilate/para-aminobenzoate synthase component I